MVWKSLFKYACLGSILFSSVKAFALYPEELVVNSVYDGDHSPSHSEQYPCVVTEVLGTNSVEGVLERLGQNMGEFNWTPEQKRCDIDANTRLVLFKPLGLTDSQIERNTFQRTHTQYVKGIRSEIKKALRIVVPAGEHLIVAGYKTLYHTFCLGNHCDDWDFDDGFHWGVAVFGHFPVDQIVRDKMTYYRERTDPRRNWILDCDFFTQATTPVICDPNDNRLAYQDKGYHAEIVILNEGSVEFVVNGRLSLRYLDIELKSSNAKIKFSGSGTVEFTEVGIYGEAALESLVEFGPAVHQRSVELKMNSRRSRSLVSYGLGLFANHAGIENFIAVSTDYQKVVALDYWFTNDASYPALKLAYPAGSGIPNPLLVREDFFPNKVFCYKEAEDREECELDANHRNLGFVVALEPKDGGSNDPNTYHFARRSIILSEGVIPLTENGLYYTDNGDPVSIETRPVSRNGNSDKGEDEDNGEKEIPMSGDEEDEDLSGIPCPPDTARNAEGFCIRTQVAGPARADDDAELDEETGSNARTDAENDPQRDPWARPADLVASDEGGCSLNRKGNPQGWVLFPVFLLAMALLQLRIYLNK